MGLWLIVWLRRENDTDSSISTATAIKNTTIITIEDQTAAVENNAEPVRKDVNSASQTPENTRVVLSMTTMPGRIACIQPTLDSLLFQQTKRADKLYLVLPQGRPQYVIPSFVKNYTRAGYVTVLQPSFDYGAIAKMMHTLPEEEVVYNKERQQQQQQRDNHRPKSRILHPLRRR